MSLTCFLSLPYLLFSLLPFSLPARGRGCQSSCAPHLGRSASTAKEPWVPVSLHGNAWQPITITATHTSVERPPLLIASRSCQEIFTTSSSIKRDHHISPWVSLQNRGYADIMYQHTYYDSLQHSTLYIQRNQIFRCSFNDSGTCCSLFCHKIKSSSLKGLPCA